MNLLEGLQTVQQKLIAQKALTDEIMYEPDVWPKEVEPLFTTIEVYEMPGVNKMLGLESNRTAIHSAPPEKTNNSTVKLQVATRGYKVHTGHRQIQLSEDSRDNPYFKNYVTKAKNVSDN